LTRISGLGWNLRLREPQRPADSLINKNKLKIKKKVTEEKKKIQDLIKLGNGKIFMNWILLKFNSQLYER